jgi:glycosyltransferase involved in cell wall biosynthesis
MSAPTVLALRRRRQFDLMDAGSSYPDGVAVAALATLVDAPFAVTVDGDDCHLLSGRPVARALVRWALRRAALVVTHSQALQRRVVALGVAESRTAVIPNGVDVEQFRPLDRDTSRACLGIPSPTRLLLTVARLHRSKGLVMLVDALRQLADANPELRLVILGDPDPDADATPGIRAAIVRSRLQGRVTLVSGRSRNELVWWYNAADLVYVATAGDGSAHALFEAMACGAPCIVTDAAGQHDEITDERCGLLAAADSVSLARVIDVALQRPWDRGEIVRHAQTRSWAAVGAQWRARLSAISGCSSCTVCPA